MLSLSYYTGNLAQKLAADSIVAHSIYFVENETLVSGTNISLSKKRLFSVCTKIHDILFYEFVDKNVISY